MTAEPAAEIGVINPALVRGMPQAPKPQLTVIEGGKGKGPQGKVEKSKPNIVAQSELISGGDPNKEAKLNPKAFKYIRDVLKRRHDDVVEMQARGTVLGDIDRAFLRLNFMEELNKGNLNKQDAALAWHALYDELTQKQIAAEMLIGTTANMDFKPLTLSRSSSRLDSLRDLPVVGSAMGDPRVSVVTTKLRNPTIPATGIARVFSLLHAPQGSPLRDEQLPAHAQYLGYSGWPEKDIRTDLKNTAKLLQQLEKSMYPNGFRNPRIRLRLGFNIDPLDYGDSSGKMRKGGRGADMRQVFRRETKYQRDQIMAEMLRSDPGRFRKGITPEEAFDTLLMRSPLEANRILLQANEHAFMQTARGYAVEIMQGKYRDASTEAILARANELKEAPKKKPEDIVLLDKERGEAETEATNSETKLQALRNELKKLKEGVDGASPELDTKQKAYDDTTSKLTSVESTSGTMTSAAGEIDRLRQKIDGLIAGINGSPGAPGIPAVPPLAGKDRSNAMQSITEITKLRDAHITALREALSNKGHAELELNSVKNRIKQLEGAAAVAAGPGVTATPVIPSQIEKAKADLVAARKTKRAADEKYEKATTSVDPEGVTADRTERAEALEKGWVSVVNSRKEIHKINFGQDSSGDFTKERLADITITDGQVAGAERIRRLIFQTVDKKGFSPERVALARKMLSDEAIARAIIQRFDLPINLPMPRDAHGNMITFRQLIERHDTSKATLADLPKGASKASRTTAEQTARAWEVQLAQHSIEFLKYKPKSEISNLINAIVDAGVREAELGNPYLTDINIQI